MAIITNPGASQSVAIEQSDTVVLDLTYSDLGTAGSPPPQPTPSNATVINAYGARKTVVLADGSSLSSSVPLGGYNATGFVLSASFSIGDEVEFLVIPAHPRPYALWDENGNALTISSAANGIARKIASGTGQNWLFI
jgi:hypothetical protein